jgi:uncharacterized OB-fold protein
MVQERTKFMTNPGTFVVNETAASIDLRFIAPGLVSIGANGVPQLIGGRCRDCEARSFPRAEVCTACLSENIETINLPDQGNLYSYSIIHQAPKNWAVPYALGYIDLPGDVRVLAHLDVPADKIEIDMAMRLSVGVVGTDMSGASLMSFTFKPV